MDSPFIFCLMGPTASGKTALASQLIHYFPFELISVDSAMIYRGMDIGTAKPSAEELKVAPHHLIDILDPTETYSAAQFCEDVHQLAKAIMASGKWPLLVGGTMMYFHALQKGLVSLPKADESLRQQLESEALSFGWPKLHQRLMQVDPKTAQRIHAHDAQRIQRALEVYYLSGKSLSALQAETDKQPSQYQFVNLSMIPAQRSWLHQRIANRWQQMLKQGLIEEVRSLKGQWALDNNKPSMRCVGYRQVLAFLEGQYDQRTLYEKGLAATRQLAKRQLTWLRQWKEVCCFAAEDPGLLQALVEHIEIKWTSSHH